MHYARFVTYVVAAAAFLGCCACERSESESPANARSTETAGEVTFTDAEKRQITRLSPLGEVPPDETNAVFEDDRAAAFGQFLFYDTRLSGNGKVSCASCHQPDHGFSTPDKLGHGLGSTPRHPPSLLNVAYHHWYDWDGKADSLWSQAMRPLESPAEQAIARTDVARVVYDHPELRSAYEKIFGEMPDFSDEARFPRDARPTPDQPDSEGHRAWMSMSAEDRTLVNDVFANVTKSLAAYERELVSGNAPFDRFARAVERGEPSGRDAISASAKRGLKLFLGRGNCVACHNGPNFSDGSFHNLGLPDREWLPDGPDRGRQRGVDIVKESVFNAKGPHSDETNGKRAKWLEYLTRTPEDVGQFKTPTLRNVARTPPYMHGGHFEDLHGVVEFYSTLPGQAEVGHREEMLEPLGFTDREIDDLVAFLETLDGEPLPDELTRQPESPLPEN